MNVFVLSTLGTLVYVSKYSSTRQRYSLRVVRPRCRSFIDSVLLFERNKRARCCDGSYPGPTRTGRQKPAAAAAAKHAGVVRRRRRRRTRVLRWRRAYPSDILNFIVVEERCEIKMAAAGGARPPLTPHDPPYPPGRRRRRVSADIDRARRRGCRPFKEQITTLPSTAGTAAASTAILYYNTVSSGPPHATTEPLPPCVYV